MVWKTEQLLKLIDPSTSPKSAKMMTPAIGALIALLWRETLPDAAAWSTMLPEAERQGLLLTLAFLARPLNLPETLGIRLRETRHDATLCRLHAEQQLRKLGALALELGIPLILLKGPVTATAYPHPAARSFNDLDVLAPSLPQAQQVFDALLQLGYQPVSESRTSHLTSLGLPGSHLTVEVHCDAIEILPTLRSDSLWWSSATPLPERPGLLALNPIDHALYFITHAVEKHGMGVGLRGVYDFSCWTRRWEAEQWETIVARAKARGVTRALRIMAALETWAQGRPWAELPWSPYLAPPPEAVVEAAQAALFNTESVRVPAIWRDYPREGWRGWLTYTREVLTSGARLPASQIPQRIAYLVRTYSSGLWGLLLAKAEVRHHWKTQRTLQDWLHKA